MLIGCGKHAVVTDITVVPEPVFQNSKDGFFTISSSTCIFFQNLSQNAPTVKYVTRTLRKYHFHTSLSGAEKDNCIIFQLNDTINPEIGEEGYILEVTSRNIRITANTETGMFYGFQTFMQLLPDDIGNVRYSKVSIPQTTILDYPRFTWRGSHLDVSRHFFSVNQVKKHLDLMAAYKLNKFHWHLTDDHGWRIEIERYPELNDVGSWRVDRSGIPWGEAEPAGEFEAASYGGFYTKEEITEIVEYAAELHIDVIPEIEIPGHCSEILAAYPEFACANDDTTYQVQIGPYWPPRAILCAGNDTVLQFLRDVLDEVIPLFPYDYIHIGGDEAVKDNWRRCPRCQARMKELHLKNEEQLQGWMIQQIEQYVTLQGKRIIGWDEILDGGISNQATVLSWRGYDGAKKAAQRGNNAILCPTEFCYLDYYQANPVYQPAAMNHLITLYKCYQFDPMPPALPAAKHQYILGGQANLWTEFIDSPSQLEYMLLPRLCAISECLWSQPDSKSWPRFRDKMIHHRTRLRAMGYNVCDGSFQPILTTVKLKNGDVSVTIDCENPKAVVYYTTDGSDPTPESKRYGAPFCVKPGTQVKTITYFKNLPQEEVYTFPI